MQQWDPPTQTKKGKVHMPRALYKAIDFCADQLETFMYWFLYCSIHVHLSFFFARFHLALQWCFGISRDKQWGSSPALTNVVLLVFCCDFKEKLCSQFQYSYIGLKV